MHEVEHEGLIVSRRGSARALFVVLLGCVSIAGTVRGEIEPLPPIEAVDGIKPETHDDEARLRGIRFALLDWEDGSSKMSRAGLDVEVRLVPDLLASRVAKAYFAARRDGKTHAQALGAVAASWKDWKKLDGRPALEVRLANPGYRRPRDERRIFTFEKNLTRDGVLVRNARGSRIRADLASEPVGLAVRELRVKKFWRTKDGATRRTPAAGANAGDPAAIGREAVISKPFRAAIIEEKPAEFDIIIDSREAERNEVFTFALRSWKSYEGPFTDDLIDLNQDRAWEEIPAIELRVDPPAGRLEVRPELRALVEEARKAAEKE